MSINFRHNCKQWKRNQSQNLIGFGEEKNLFVTFDCRNIQHSPATKSSVNNEYEKCHRVIFFSLIRPFLLYLHTTRCPRCSFDIFWELCKQKFEKRKKSFKADWILNAFKPGGSHVAAILEDEIVCAQKKKTSQ